jgi:hypothetical protein
VEYGSHNSSAKNIPRSFKKLSFLQRDLLPIDRREGFRPGAGVPTNDNQVVFLKNVGSIRHKTLDFGNPLKYLTKTTRRHQRQSGAFRRTA